MLKMVYLSLAQSIISYGIEVWGKTYIIYIGLTLRLQ